MVTWTARCRKRPSHHKQFKSLNKKRAKVHQKALARCVIQRFLVPICAQISANFFANLQQGILKDWNWWTEAWHEKKRCGSRCDVCRNTVAKNKNRIQQKILYPIEIYWRARRDSNPLPLAPEANALSRWATGTWKDLIKLLPCHVKKVQP